jgi:hypothetical protein
MKTYLSTLLIIILSACKPTESYNYVMNQNNYATTYQFKQSKAIVFNDSISREWFIGNSNREPFVPNISEIVRINRKLETDYVKFVREGQNMINYDALPDRNYFLKHNKEIYKYVKSIQSKINTLDKQFCGYIDSLGQKIIVIKIITPEEKQLDLDSQKYWIGHMSDLKYNIENSMFFRE